jgi:hypothetical protein
MFGLNLVNPSLAINLLKKSIENQLKRKIDKFDIIYNSSKDDLYFLIDKVKYEFDNEKIKTAICYQVSDTLKKGQKLDYVIIKVDNDNIDAFIYYKEDNKKFFIEHKLK